MGQQYSIQTKYLENDIIKENSLNEDSYISQNLEEYDSPFRGKQDLTFLQTQIVASNYLLSEQKLRSCPVLNKQNIAVQKQRNITAIQPGQNVQQNMLGSVSIWRKIDEIEYFQKKSLNFYDHYQNFDKLGHGSFGNVYITVNKTNKAERAVKVIRKNHLKEATQIDILKKLDHPNIVKLFEVYDHENFVYLVQEYCKGGPVSKLVKETLTINKQRKESVMIPELAVSNIMRQLLHAMAYLHKKNIIHGDVKLDNIVFVEKNWRDITTPTIRLIDFGLSKRIEFKIMKKNGSVTGTKNYMAPEIFEGWISEKNDIWSCGIVLYVLLSGKLPFIRKQKQCMETIIMNTKLSFESEQWNNISCEAKRLVSRMLQTNFRLRPRAQQCLNNEWIQSTQSQRSRIHRFSIQIFKRLSKYETHNNFVATIQSYLSFFRCKPIEQEAELKQLFNFLDHNRTGQLTIESISKSLTDFSGEIITFKDMQKLLRRIDMNKSGLIDYSEFKTAFYDRQILFMKQSLEQAFKYFDKDKSGFIEKFQFIQIMKQCKNKQIQSILQEIDQNLDNKISLNQFIDYFEHFKHHNNK